MLQNSYPVHLVGSLFPAEKGDCGEEAVRDAYCVEFEAFEQHPEDLTHVPSGERRGASPGYVQRTVNHLANRLEVAERVIVLESPPDEAGIWQTMEQRTRLRFPRNNHIQPGDLDYASAAIADWEAYTYVRNEQRATQPTAHSGSGDPTKDAWSERRFQYSIPTPASLAIVALGPKSTEFTGTHREQIHQARLAVKALVHTIRHYKYIRDATIAEVRTIADSIPINESVAQVEATAEMVATAQAYAASPRLLGPMIARFMGRRIANLINRMPESVAIDIHYCTGSLNNKGETTMKDLRPFVALANSTTKRLERIPQHVHCPVAPSDAPASLAPEYYRPLSRFIRRDETTFYAGYVNTHQSVAELQQVMGMVVENLPDQQKVGISTSCGLGRYPREIGLKVLKQLSVISSGASED